MLDRDLWKTVVQNIPTMGPKDDDDYIVNRRPQKYIYQLMSYDLWASALVTWTNTETHRWIPPDGKWIVLTEHLEGADPIICTFFELLQTLNCIHWCPLFDLTSSGSHIALAYVVVLVTNADQN